jgi:hypothetical protein
MRVVSRINLPQLTESFNCSVHNYIQVHLSSWKPKQAVKALKKSRKINTHLCTVLRY